MSDLKVFTAEGEEWVVASSPEDAAKVYEEHVGEALVFALNEPAEWEECPDGDPFTFTDHNPDPPVKETRTYGEWAKLKGRGHLASANV